MLLTELLFVFLHSLSLNQISDAGARALREALVLNKSLTELARERVTNGKIQTDDRGAVATKLLFRTMLFYLV